MFKFEEICELIRLVGSTQVASVELEHAGSRLKIEGVAAFPPAAGATTLGGPTVPVAPLFDTRSRPTALAGPGEVPSLGDDDPAVYPVTSPIVGTFYRAPNPDTEAYVKVGDFVEKGQVLCIVEAMKLMNEIEAEVDGKITEIFVLNATPVEFGEKLFRIEPA